MKKITCTFAKYFAINYDYVQGPFSFVDTNNIRRTCYFREESDGGEVVIDKPNGFSWNVSN